MYKRQVQERWEMAHKMFRELYELELLREDWDMLLMESEELLYSHGADAYKGISSDFKRWAKEESNIQIQAEQLLVYFIFTYFCGAVYDGRIYAKVQMAVISTFHIYEPVSYTHLDVYKRQHNILDQTFTVCLYLFFKIHKSLPPYARSLYI